MSNKLSAKSNRLIILKRMEFIIKFSLRRFQFLTPVAPVTCILKNAYLQNEDINSNVRHFPIDVHYCQSVIRDLTWKKQLNRDLTWRGKKTRDLSWLAKFWLETWVDLEKNDLLTTLVWSPSTIPNLSRLSTAWRVSASAIDIFICLTDNLIPKQSSKRGIFSKVQGKDWF